MFGASSWSLHWRYQELLLALAFSRADLLCLSCVSSSWLRVGSMFNRCLLRAKLKTRDLDVSQSSDHGNRERMWRGGRWAC